MAASSSKLLNLTLSSTFLRSCRLASTSIFPTASRRHPGSLLSLRFCSAAPAAVDVAAGPAAVDVAAEPAVAAVPSGHPWPEWGEFLDKLRAKGYFEQVLPASGVSAGEGAAGDGEAAASDNAAAAAADNGLVIAADSVVASKDTYPFRDLNIVKNACLKFARDRYELLSSLPKQDIQAIVKCGCPNINRKPVNSAKRLREFLNVEEKDACKDCKLQKSCDRAYLTPKAENEVRTADVMRILLDYAIDTKSLSGENSINESVQKSARKLLSELIILSDTTIDPSHPKPVFQTSSKQQSSDKSKAMARVSVGKGGETTAAEMKMGDWLCPTCNFLNFARNRRCLECKADGPKKVEAATAEMKKGDWICIQCHFMNFSRNKICFKCEEPRPKRQLNPGEWECPSCDFINFGRNRVCKKCNLDRPEDDTQHSQLGLRNTRGAGKRRSFDYSDQDSDNAGDAKTEMKKGDWICTQCDFHNFGRNRVCKKCNLDRPEDDTQHSQVGLRNTTGAGKRRSSDYSDQDSDNHGVAKAEMKMGDWICTQCYFLNFGRNRVCKKCNLDRPEEDTEHSQLGVRNTRGSGKRRSFDDSDQDSDNDGDASSYKGFCKHAASRSRGFGDLADGRLTSKPRSVQGRRVHGHVVSRSTPARKRSTAA